MNLETKQLLFKIAVEIEEKMYRLKTLQDQLDELIRNTPEDELSDFMETDQEFEKISDRINKLVEELWG